MLRLKMEIDPPLERLKMAIELAEREVLNDLRDFYDKRARRLVAEEIARVFVTQGYGTWQPLSERYKLWKSQAYPGRTILRLKNRYFRASTMKGATGNLYWRSRTNMQWGIDLSAFRLAYEFPYPIIHERGSDTGKLPKRPVFALAERSPMLHAKLKDSFTKWIHLEVNRRFNQVFR